MIAYASNTRTKRNLAELRRRDWRIMITPFSGKPAAGFRYAIDNGAWRYYSRGESFNERVFESTVLQYGMDADFIVLPDIVMGGMESLQFSASWIGRLTGSRLLLAVQDGMEKRAVVNLLMDHPSIGIFIGGSTKYKLWSMPYWGSLCRMLGRWCHVGRVNSRRRIRLCHEAGVTSFDGSGASKFQMMAIRLDAERRQGNLLSELGDFT